MRGLQCVDPESQVYPEAIISVDASCCAGVTPEKHNAALETMKSCQIDVYGQEE